MATRTVRLDDEDEAILREMVEATGLSVSGVLKRGLMAARDSLRAESLSRPWDVYCELDLGPGGTSKGSARSAKRDVRSLLQERARR